LKENLLWIRHLQTIEELRQTLLAFKDTYDGTWLIERHGFISPAAFRQKQLQHASPSYSANVPARRQKCIGRACPTH
jgi:putative transposase